MIFNVMIKRTVEGCGLDKPFCNVLNVLACRLGKLWQLLALNILSVTYKMLFPLATIDCGYNGWSIPMLMYVSLSSKKPFFNTTNLYLFHHNFIKNKPTREAARDRSRPYREFWPKILIFGCFLTIFDPKNQNF